MAHAVGSKAEQLAEAKRRVREAFITLETKEGSKLLDARDLPTVLRCLGVNPTTAQVAAVQERLLATAGGEPSSTSAGGLLALEHCEGPIAAWLLEDSLLRDDYHTLLRAFRALDPDGGGWLEAAQLRAVISGCADGLTADEANAMIDAAADSNARVNYQEFALRLATDGRPA